MSSKIGILVVHGIGSQGKQYANPFLKKLLQELKKLGVEKEEIKIQAVWWAPLLSEIQKTLWKRMTSTSKISWRKTREFIVDVLADSLAYQKVPSRDSSTYTKIHEEVQYSLKRLRNKLGNKDKPLIVLGHSLGSVIMSNYIWDCQQKYKKPLVGETSFENMDTLTGFITFGSNIPLFALAYDPIKAINFPGKKIDPKTKKIAKWLNFYDKDDVLGFPLKSTSASYEKTVSEDIEINAGGLFSFWNPISHTKYWTDKDFIRQTAKYIKEVVKSQEK